MTQPRIKRGVPTGPGSKIPAMPETIKRTPSSCETACFVASSRASVGARTGDPAAPTLSAELALFSDECNFPSSRVTSTLQDFSRERTPVQPYAPACTSPAKVQIPAEVGFATTYRAARRAAARASLQTTRHEMRCADPSFPVRALIDCANPRVMFIADSWARYRPIQ
jgi:hypothetical protein